MTSTYVEGDSTWEAGVQEVRKEGAGSRIPKVMGGRSNKKNLHNTSSHFAFKKAPREGSQQK